MDYKNWWQRRRGKLIKKKDQKERERLLKEYAGILEEYLKVSININDLS